MREVAYTSWISPGLRRLSMSDLLHPSVPPPAADCPPPLDGTLRIAMASLGRCRRSVCALPLFAPSERLHRGLIALVAWYERLCEDDRYTNDALDEGLRALARITVSPKTSTIPSVIVSARAVRVAEELVAYRRAMEPDPTALEAAMVDLMIAMRRTKSRPAPG